MITDRTELLGFLYRECMNDSDLLSTVLDMFIRQASQSVIDELEDLLVNHFGDDLSHTIPTRTSCY